MVRHLSGPTISWYHQHMSKSTGDTTKKKRPPAPGTPVMVRLQPDMLAALDKFIDEQSDISRPEAVRLILRDWLIGNQMLDKSS